LQKELADEQTKNAEARELVELLEWAAGKSFDVLQGEIFTSVSIARRCGYKLIAREDTTLLALRAAKKIVEGQK
jgi:hypothetical protein